MIPKQPLEVSDFSGGITDHYLSAQPNKYQKASNLLIDRYSNKGKLRSRYGSKLLSDDYPRPYPFRIDFLKYVEYDYISIQTLYAFVNDTLYASLSYSSYFNDWNELRGPTNNALVTGADATPPSIFIWQNQMVISQGFKAPVVIFTDNAGDLKGVTAGVPKPTNCIPTPTTVGTGFNYLYRFIFAYTYISNGKTFIMRGEYLEKAVSAGAAAGPGGGTINITSITPHANNVNQNYDTASLGFVIEIYRTTHNGTNFYLVGFVINGTTTYADVTTDAQLLQNEPMYTEGGLPQNGRPPIAYINHLDDNTAFYARCLGSNEAFAIQGAFYNRFYQSIPGAPLSVPATFFEEMEADITGFTSYRGVKICMLDTGPVFRISGGYDEFGDGSFDKVKISERAGCINYNSVVQTEIGVFWAGIDGFYFSDGYQCVRISSGLDKTFALISGEAFSDKRNRLQGKYDSLNNRVYWTTQAEQTGEPKSCLVLHLEFGISDDMPFTTIEGGEYYSNTALEFVGETMVRGDDHGYVFAHEPGVFTDLRANPDDPIAEWRELPVIYDFISNAHDFGTMYARKLVTSLSIYCVSATNLSLGIESINDNGRQRKKMAPIRYRGSLTWGDPTIIWGDPTLIWNRQGDINEKRRFPTPGSRCMHKQIRLTNESVVIFISDFLGLATIDATNPGSITVERTEPWPSSVLGYQIAFEDDGFEKEFTIYDVDGNTIYIYDEANGIPPASVVGTRWVIRGKPKNEALFLFSYEIEYALLSRSQNLFRKSSLGEPSV